MATLMLTARFIDSVKPQMKRVEYFDKEVPGLSLRVTPAGAKSWTVRYWHRGRQRRMTLGSAAVIPLVKARERARDELHAASKGADPATEKQIERQADTFAQLAELYLEKYAKPRKRSWKKDDNLLRRKILPQWRHRALKDIRRRDVLDLVEGVAEAGAPINANRVAALLSKIFTFALDRELIAANPATRIPRPGQERQRDRVLTDDELRSLWASFERFDQPMTAFWKLRLLTMQRGGEVAAMRWTELDLDSGWWTIPSKSSKNKLAHRVPLNQSALQLLRSIEPANRERASEYVLGAWERRPGAGARGKRQQAEAAATFVVHDFRGHDLRRTAASYMASGGIPRLTISKILNHVERGVTAVYDRHSYDAEKRAALTWWDQKLKAILAKDAVIVLPFVKGA
jgi:integrase